jgi:hypothetical protein
VIITILYYLIVAFFTFVLLANFIRTRDVQKAILYLLILMPFILRLARLK